MCVKKTPFSAHTQNIPNEKTYTCGRIIWLKARSMSCWEEGVSRQKQIEEQFILFYSIVFYLFHLSFSDQAGLRKYILHNILNFN